ncbi:MAG: alanine--tRNA ligase [Candidatus Hodarchaeota archaeon]
MVLSDKEQKQVFKKEASKKPDKYYPTTKLRQEGFSRKKCKCGTFFWTVNDDQVVCGDPACSGGFKVVDDNPSKIKLDYIGVWNKIVEMLGPRGYKKVDRYPVVARWNPTTEFTIASIAAFQPYVITGEMEPPAKKLVIPQFCLRFGDIDNVGITGSHCTGFVMIGQHAFLTPDEWDQEQLFTDIYEFLTIGLGVIQKEITIHEDAWAGGGSFGPCLEFFSRGVELFNQVYTMFEQTPDGPVELKLKVLDMGLGMERIAWFTQATPNMYQAIFPEVLDKMRELAKVEVDFALYKKFSQYSAFLNIDEVEDINEAWGKVSKAIGVPLEELRQKIMPMAAIYSIAEHARSLLLAITDGALPSNTGGGYNLRVILRRALSFIDMHDWALDLGDICEWHALELKNLFPELLEGIDNVKKILAYEKVKYEETKENVRRIVKKIVKKDEKITLDKLLELYDSQGISPELLKKEADLNGKKVNIPENFYKLISERHEKTLQVHATQKELDIGISGLPDTERLYFDDYKMLEIDAKVLKIKEKNVILDRSNAYPTSGGQLHDIGSINKQKFNDVIKMGGVIVHVMDEPPKFKEGDKVKLRVDEEWRDQLTQHHTATHVINAAARAVLGEHVNQAGAKKTEKKAHLDITHYKSLSKDELQRIEEESNRLVQIGTGIKASFIPRAEAEEKYGMRIYQGGAVPGKKLRIVDIGNGLDVEACGGTHLHDTGEIGVIKITSSSKIQDGIVRLKFTAGSAAKKAIQWEKNILGETAEILGVEPNQVFSRIKELFQKVKKLKKLIKKDKDIPDDLLVLENVDMFDGDVLGETANFLKTQPEHVPKNAKKFLDQYNDLVAKAKERVKDKEKKA